MASFQKRLRILVPALLTLAVVIFLSLPRQGGDPDFDARVERPAYPAGAANRPVVLIDQAHFNFHTMGGRYKPFADLIGNDGYEVRPNKRKFSEDGLDGCCVLVIANALGLGGAAQQLLNSFRLEGKVDVTGSAFSRKECDAVERWVREGGSLLLVSDHAPTGKAAASLSARFGVRMANGYAEDDAPNHDPVTDNWGFLVFSRLNGLLAEHAVTQGRDAAERVDRVVTFTGQALEPSSGTSFLTLSPSAREYPRRRSPNDEFRSAAGLSQGVAIEYGKGRVVILGEAAMLTSQKAGRPGLVFHFGLDWPDSNNRRLVLNIMHWLSRAL